MSYSLLNKVQRKVFFEGDSLFARAYGTSVVFGYYAPSSIYNGRTYAEALAYNCLAVGGRRMSEIYASISTSITPYLRTGDVIFLWAGTNDIAGDGLTGQQTWDNYLSPYATAVIAAGAVLVIGTTIARDSGEANLAAEIISYNTLIRNNASTIGYSVCDFAADSHFDTAADASNTTYYLSDKIHLATGGYDVIVPIGITALNAALATMVVTFPVAVLADTTNTVNYSLSAFTPSANSLLIVLLTASNTIIDNGVTGGGLAWVQLISNTPISSRAQACYYAKVGASPVSTTITWNCTGDTAAGCVMVVYQITKHNIANPIAQFKANANVTGSNPTITLDQNMNTNNSYIYFIDGSNNPPGATPPANWIEDCESGFSTPTVGVTSGHRVNGETGNTVTVTAASMTYDMMFVEIQ